MRKVSIHSPSQQNVGDSSSNNNTPGQFCIGNLDLLNLSLNYSADGQNITNNNNIDALCQGDNNSPTIHQTQSNNFRCHALKKLEGSRILLANYQRPKKNNTTTNDNSAPTSQHTTVAGITKKESNTSSIYTEFLHGSTTLRQTQIIDVISKERFPRDKFGNDDVGNGKFPFKLTPSGHFKIKADQVAFESEKLSVLVASPRTTRVNIHSDATTMNRKKPEQPPSPPNNPRSYAKTKAMEELMKQVNTSSFESLMEKQPVRHDQIPSEYDTKETAEILEPELNLTRLGYSGNEVIQWEKINMPHKKDLFQEMRTRLTAKKNVDCKILIDDSEFDCHLLVLQCYSELFDNYVAVKKIEIPSENCTAESFSFIYEWMIGDDKFLKTLTRHNVLDIFNASKYLKIPDLVEQCWAFIDNDEIFEEDTAFLLFMDAKHKNAEQVRQLMLPLIKYFFLPLVSSQDWLLLDVDDVQKLLSSNFIVINCEVEVFLSGIRWLRYDWSERKQYIFDVMTCVRFGNFAPWQLIDIIRNQENREYIELIETEPGVANLIDDGIAYVIIKNWYAELSQDFKHWVSVMGLEEPGPRNFTHIDQNHTSYRDFLIFLHQYRVTKFTSWKIRKVDQAITADSRTGPFLVDEKIIVPKKEEYLTKNKVSVNKKKGLW